MDKYKVLITVALPSTGPRLLRVAELLAPSEASSLTALHCRRVGPTREDGKAGPGSAPKTAVESDADIVYADDAEAENPLGPLTDVANGREVELLDIIRDDIADAILATAEERSADLLLMGWHRPLVNDDSEPGPVRDVIEKCHCDVAMLLARQVRPVTRVLVPFHGGRHDRRALELAARMERSSGVHVTVLHVVDPQRPESASGTGWSKVVEEVSDGRVRLKVVECDDPVDAAVREAWTGYDLIVAGASEVWGVDFSIFSERLQRLAFATPASLLVVRARTDRSARDRSVGAADSDRGGGAPSDQVPEGALATEPNA